MTNPPLRAVLGYVRRVTPDEGAAQPGDAELLGRFAARRDEVAFAAGLNRVPFRLRTTSLDPLLLRLIYFYHR